MPGYSSNRTEDVPVESLAGDHVDHVMDDGDYGAGKGTGRMATVGLVEHLNRWVVLHLWTSGNRWVVRRYFPGQTVRRCVRH
jgi:hypothetical protein